MYYDMMAALQRYQLLCFGIAGLAIFALMAIFLRSPRVALLALLPSVLPIAVTLGLLGWWGYGLDPASTMVATIVLGVGVDDAIHMLSHYRAERLRGVEVDEAVAASVAHVGRPVIVSALVLAAAFWSLTVSPMSSVASFGFLAGLAILVALAADLLVLPALLLRRTLGDAYPVASGEQVGP
jgi:predicted RND superfamily exporter protein